MPQGINLLTLFNSTFTEREQFMTLAQRVAFLTKTSLDPKNNRFGTRSKKDHDILKRIPANSWGVRALKGLSAALNNTLNPAGITFFKLATDPEFELNDAQSAGLDKFFRKEEQRIVEFLARHSFDAFSQTAIEHVLVEGTNGVRIDEAKGFMLFRLDQLSIDRTGANVNWIVFQQSIPNDPMDESPEDEKMMYTYINRQSGEVYSQHEDDKEATLITGVKVDEETGDLIEMDGMNPKLWFVFSTEVPQFHNFAQSFYMDHLSLLEDIEATSVALKAAKRIAGQFFYALDPAIPPVDLTPQRFAAIENFEVVAIPANKVQPWTAGAKITDWEWIDRKLNQDGQQLLEISAVGLLDRRGSIKTATEVRALRAELEMLVGATSSVLAQTLYFNVVDACIDILEIRARLAADPALEGVDRAIINKLVRGIVVTGAPDVGKERDLEKMVSGTETALAMFGEQALAQINVRGFMEALYDNLGVNTEGILKKEQMVENDQQRLEELAAQGTAKVKAATPNGQARQAVPVLPGRGLV